MDAASWATHLKLLPWIKVFFLHLEFSPSASVVAFVNGMKKEGLLSPSVKEKWRFASVCHKTTPFSCGSNVLLMCFEVCVLYLSYVYAIFIQGSQMSWYICDM